MMWASLTSSQVLQESLFNLRAISREGFLFSHHFSIPYIADCIFRLMPSNFLFVQCDIYHKRRKKPQPFQNTVVWQHMTEVTKYKSFLHILSLLKMNIQERLYTDCSSYWLPLLMTSRTVNISLYSLAAHFTDYRVIHVKMCKKPKQTNSQKKTPQRTLGIDTDVQPLSGPLLLLMAKSFCFRRTILPQLWHTAHG